MMESNAQEASSVARPVAGVVDRDLPCVRCGYNLRTLTAEGRCPECGAAVALTLTLGGVIEQSRPGYLRRLSWGCGLLCVARLGAAVGILATAVLQTEAFSLVAMSLAGLAYVAGLFLLAAREHPCLPPEMPWCSRLLKLASIVMLLALLVAVASAILHARWWLTILGLSTALPIWVWFLDSYNVLICSMTIFAAAYLVCPILETRLMVRLAKRLADGWLGEHAIIAGVGAVASPAFMWTVGILPLSMIGRLMFVGILISLVFLLLFWLWMAACSWIAAKGFRRAAGMAAMRWRQTDAAAGLGG